MSHANRGKPLESLLETTNRHYRRNKVALIEKVPNAWKVVRRGQRIISAFPERKTSPDFLGVVNGRSICIEAKSTKERTRFPLDNIGEHQLDYLKQHQELGGLSFLIIEFAKHHEIYMVPLDFVLPYIEEAEAGGRKSIPYQDILLNCDIIEPDFKKGYPVHYLKSIL